MFIQFFSEASQSLGLATLRVRVKKTQVPGSSEESKAYWKPWKRKKVYNTKWEKMLIPLPIPHPVHIAISIYNRDSDLSSAIPVDSDLCWDILRSIEDCYGDIQAMKSMTRFRGGIGMDSSMDSLDSSGESSGGDMKDMDSRESVDGTETLPCTNRSIMQNTQITITTNNTQDIAESMNNASVTSGGTNTRNISHSNSNASMITPTNTSYHWTLSNLEAANGNNQFNRRRNNSNNNNTTETVRVDLASPEDISIEIDSRLSNYGTTV